MGQFLLVVVLPVLGDLESFIAVLYPRCHFILPHPPYQSKYETVQLVHKYYHRKCQGYAQTYQHQQHRNIGVRLLTQRSCTQTLVVVADEEDEELGEVGETGAVVVKGVVVGEVDEMVHEECEGEGEEQEGDWLVESEADVEGEDSSVEEGESDVESGHSIPLEHALELAEVLLAAKLQQAQHQQQQAEGGVEHERTGDIGV